MDACLIGLIRNLIEIWETEVKIHASPKPQLSKGPWTPEPSAETLSGQ